MDLVVPLFVVFLNRMIVEIVQGGPNARNEGNLNEKTIYVLGVHSHSFLSR